jgi:uncharacterized protein YfkK (UPF0435 family)
MRWCNADERMKRHVPTEDPLQIVNGGVIEFDMLSTIMYYYINALLQIVNGDVLEFDLLSTINVILYIHTSSDRQRTCSQVRSA